MDAVLKPRVELLEGEILYIVSFLRKHMLEGIHSGFIVQKDDRGFSLDDALMYEPIVEDMTDFSEKFRIDADQAWNIFINNS